MINNGRIKNIDALKGILIILVVLAHYKTGIIHDIIFLFHMPVFFMVSGFLLSNNKLQNVNGIAIFGILSIPIFRIEKDMVFPPFRKRYFLNVIEFSGLSITG